MTSLIKQVQPTAADAKTLATAERLSSEELRKVHAYWRACTYLAAGMIYLRSNPLLRDPLKPEHIKKRLLGHWGTSPGLSFMYVHLNRLINKYDLDAIFLAGPGHGAPGVLAPIYLEGTYSEVYPTKAEDEDGMREFFKEFSFPGGIGSHCTPETPGSIHEGGELGYSISHAFGAAFDNPGLLVAVAVGDGESETGPLATSWHSNKFLNPIRDGAVLPILHLNGYKINNPTLLARIPREELGDLFRGYGWTPYFVEGDDPERMHQTMAATLEDCVLEIRRIQEEARANGTARRAHWPMILLRTPDFRAYAIKVDKPGQASAENTRPLGRFLRDIMRQNMTNFRVFGPDETASNKLDAVYEASKKLWLADYLPEDADGGELSPDGRVLEMLSEHTLEGWYEGYLLSGRHGFFSTYEAFAHVIDSMFNQHAKWLAISRELPWRAPGAPLNLVITSTVWRQDHNGFTHQDPGFIGPVP